MSIQDTVKNMVKGKTEKDPTAPAEIVLKKPDHKIQAGIQREDGKVLDPVTGKELKQDVSKSKNIWAPK